MGKSAPFSAKVLLKLVDHVGSRDLLLLKVNTAVVEYVFLFSQKLIFKIVPKEADLSARMITERCSYCSPDLECDPFRLTIFLKNIDNEMLLKLN